jgi:hypothetical protein
MKKKHHFVQAAYLAHFAEDGKCTPRDRLIWQYDKHSSSWVRQKVANVCFEKNLYALRNRRNNDEAVPADALENAFAEGIEAKILTVFSKIHDKREWQLDDFDRRLLSKYIAFCYFRNPLLIEKFKTISGEHNYILESPRAFKRWLNNHKDDFPEKVFRQRKKFKRVFKRSLKDGFFHQYYLNNIFKDKDLGDVSFLDSEQNDKENNSIERLTQSILNRTPILIINKSLTPFYCSDFPALIKFTNDKTHFWDLEDPSLSHVDIIFPISKSFVMLFSHDENAPEKFLATDQLIDRINTYIDNNATRFLYSSKRLN